MSIQDISAFAEIIASLGVIISLIYVARQIRQTNTLNRSATHQEISAQSVNLANSVATNPELCAVVAKVLYHDLVREEATEIERVQMAFLLTAILDNNYLMFQQIQEGILTEKEVGELKGSGTSLLARPYLASAWPILRSAYPSDYQRWVEKKFNLDSQTATLKDGFERDTGSK